MGRRIHACHACDSHSWRGNLISDKFTRRFKLLTPQQVNDVKIAEETLLKVMYPGLGLRQRRNLHKLLRDKNVALFDLDQLHQKTDDILCSLIRHQDTDYDQMVRHTEKHKARAILGPLIDSKLKLAKSGSVGISSAHLFITGSPVKVIESRTADPAVHTVKVVGHDPTYSSEQREMDAFKVKAHIGPTLDLTGVQFGDYTVIGSALSGNGRWVCECKCGRYEFRKAKAITNPANSDDKCMDCRKREYRESRVV